MNMPDINSENKSPADAPELEDHTTDSQSAVFEDSEIAGTQPDTAQPKPIRRSRREFLWLAAAFSAGLGSGYLLRGWPSDLAAGAETTGDEAAAETPDIQVSLPEAYTLPVAYGDLGPRLLAAGAIDYDLFTQVYEESGQPLTPEQLKILTSGSEAPVIINQENAYFLLNFFWATGLASQNPILTEGTMMQYGGQEKIGSFASTGGWTIGAKPVTELYASTSLFELAATQQDRLEEVADGVYRPCCDNPTSFPDCNHGMAMLGVLELLASQDVPVEEMFETAKNLNAFWFPRQTYELALAFDQGQGVDFSEADARELVGAPFSSSSGFKVVHQWLAENDLLPQAPGGGNSCGV